MKITSPCGHRADTIERPKSSVLSFISWLVCEICQMVYSVTRSQEDMMIITIIQEPQC